MKPPPKTTDYVAEYRACGYVGFSPCSTNVEKLRANVPHKIQRIHGRDVRTYLVSDCIAYKIARESIGTIKQPF